MEVPELADKLKMWRGYRRVIGFWQSTFVRLRDNTLYFASGPDAPPKFQIYIKMLKVRKEGKLRFRIYNGISVIFLKTPNRETQQKWVETL